MVDLHQVTTVLHLGRHDLEHDQREPEHLAHSREPPGLGGVEEVAVLLLRDADPVGVAHVTSHGAHDGLGRDRRFVEEVQDLAAVVEGHLEAFFMDGRGDGRADHESAADKSVDVLDHEHALEIAHDLGADRIERELDRDGRNRLLRGRGTTCTRGLFRHGRFLFLCGERDPFAKEDSHAFMIYQVCQPLFDKEEDLACFEC